MQNVFIQIIARSKRKGVSNRKIAENLGISRNTVNKIVNQVLEMNLSWNEVERMSEAELASSFSSPERAKETRFLVPDYEKLSKELAKPGVTMQLLWEEYYDQCRLNSKRAYKLTQFKKYFREHLSKIEFTDIIHHKAGERIEVDWAGTKAHWTDPDTGEIIYGYMFVGILSFSGYAFAKVVSDMKMPNWIQCHIDMFKYFGGVPAILVPDNLKTGVIKHTRETVVLNKTYEDMASHYNTVIIPTRVRSPQDKALVENTVGKLTTYIIAKLRNYQFFSMEEYNDQLLIELDKFNKKKFQKKDGSRYSIFKDFEQSALQPLPKYPYSLCEWKKAKVQRNSHIQVNKNFYSVPYELLGKEVDVKISSVNLEVFFNQNKVCEHKLFIEKRGRYCTDPSHMPPDSNQYSEWNKDRYLRWAKQKGPNVYRLASNHFERGSVEQRYYRTVHSILKLADIHGDDALDKACNHALDLMTAPGYKHIKTILVNKEYMKKETLEETKEKSEQVKGRFVRGGSYFGIKK